MMARQVQLPDAGFVVAILFAAADAGGCGFVFLPPLTLSPDIGDNAAIIVDGGSGESQLLDGDAGKNVDASNLRGVQVISGVIQAMNDGGTYTLPWGVALKYDLNDGYTTATATDQFGRVIDILSFSNSSETESETSISTTGAQFHWRSSEPTDGGLVTIEEWDTNVDGIPDFGVEWDTNYNADVTTTTVYNYFQTTTGRQKQVQSVATGPVAIPDGARPTTRRNGAALARHQPHYGNGSACSCTEMCAQGLSCPPESDENTDYVHPCPACVYQPEDSSTQEGAIIADGDLAGALNLGALFVIDRGCVGNSQDQIVSALDSILSVDYLCLAWVESPAWITLFARYLQRGVSIFCDNASYADMAAGDSQTTGGVTSWVGNRITRPVYNEKYVALYMSNIGANTTAQEDLQQTLDHELLHVGGDEGRPSIGGKGGTWSRHVDFGGSLPYYTDTVYAASGFCRCDFGFVERRYGDQDIPHQTEDSNQMCVTAMQMNNGSDGMRQCGWNIQTDLVPIDEVRPDSNPAPTCFTDPAYTGGSLCSSFGDCHGCSGAQCTLDCESIGVDGGTSSANPSYYTPAAMVGTLLNQFCDTSQDNFDYPPDAGYMYECTESCLNMAYPGVLATNVPSSQFGCGWNNRGNDYQAIENGWTGWANQCQPQFIPNGMVVNSTTSAQYGVTGTGFPLDAMVAYNSCSTIAMCDSFNWLDRPVEVMPYVWTKVPPSRDGGTYDPCGDYWNGYYYSFEDGGSAYSPGIPFSCH